jgi:hypothetical protein
MGDFYTKGEPREASAAQSMMNGNEWVLPQIYADEIAYKPPFTHWLMALFSLPQGQVTPFTSRLPSALAFVGFIACSFCFFNRGRTGKEAFPACLILLTSFELHRAAMTARVDMMLTFLTVGGLLLLFNWEERNRLKGFPVGIPVVLGLAALVKGPVGIVLPLLVFGIYLLVLRYNFWKVVIKLLPVALLSLVLPAVWYVLAYQRGGKEFFDMVYAENFGRFFGSNDLNIHYDLGHREGFWYNFITLFAGFIPWTLFLLISLFGLNYGKKLPGLKALKQKLYALSKVELFSLLAAVVIVAFYCIPVSKRSVYLMPAYPFIALFIAQYILYSVRYHPQTVRIFGWVIGVLSAGVVFIGTAAAFRRLSVEITGAARVFQNLHPNFLFFVLFAGLTVSLVILFRQLWKKNNLKVLYAVCAVYICLFIVLDGTFLPAYKDGTSIKAVAGQWQERYPFDNHNLFVMNDLGEYSNMYGLNFYLGNRFHNFEKEQASNGYLLAGKKDSEKVLAKYGEKYRFQLLEEQENKSRDGDRLIRLYRFTRP